MFRRKDESAIDFSADASAHPTSAHPAETPEYVAPSVAAAPSQPAPAAAPAITNTYVPATPRPVASAAANTGAGAPTGVYRPTPVAEFTRSPAPRGSEPQRPVASAQAATSNFASITEKAAGKPNRRVLTVGNDILLKGEIATCDRLVIEGRVEAKLSDVHTVEIAECGSFKGTAEVEDAEISGVFEGDLVVRNRLVIYASGEVRGNIGYGEIEIERGGKLTGQIKTVSGAAQTAGKKDTAETKARSAKESVAA